MKALSVTNKTSTIHGSVIMLGFVLASVGLLVDNKLNSEQERGGPMAYHWPLYLRRYLYCTLFYSREAGAGCIKLTKCRIYSDHSRIQSGDSLKHDFYKMFF